MGKRADRWLACLVVLLLVTILTMLGEASAWATGAKGNTTLLIVIEGAPPALRGAIGAELPSPWTQVDAGPVGAAAKKRQLSRSLKALENAATKDQYTSKLAMVASDVGSRAAVTIVVITKRNDRKGHVVLVADTGEALVDTYVALGAPADDAATLMKAFSDKLDALAHPEPLVAKVEPAAAASPVEAPKSDATAITTASAPGKDTPPMAPPKQPSGAELPPFVVGTLAFEIANRHLDFRGVRTNTPLAYDSGFVLTPALAVDVFPATSSGTKIVEDLGVFGDFKTSLAPNASWTRFDGGLKYRIWLRRDWNAPMLAPSVSYGQESYSSGVPSEKRPPVSYRVLRPRVDLRVPVWRLAILAGGAFLAMLDSGELADKYRDPTVVGWEADLGVTFPINKFLDVRAGFAYRRIIYWFSPEGGDTYFARGAHDQTFRPDIGVMAHL